MSLNTVKLTWNLGDLVQSGESATLSIVPTAQLVDAADGFIEVAVPRPVAFTGGTGSLPGIVANDNASIQPQGQGYTITVITASGQVIYSQTVAIDYANGAIQDLSTLTPASAAALNLYLQLPGGTPTAGSAPVATGSGTATSWQKILLAANNLSDIGSAPTARTNLGLGSAAVVALSSLLQAANNLSDLGSAAVARGNLGLGSAALLAASAVLQAANNLSDVASRQAALNNLAGAVTSGLFLRGNGTNVLMAAIQAGDLPPATGSAQGAVELAGDLAGTASSPQVTGTHLGSPLPLAQGGTGNTTGQPSGGASGDLGGSYPSPTVTATHLASALPIAQGGTGSTARNFAGLLTPTAVKTANYTAAAGDFVPCDTTSGGFTITLPNAPADLTVVGVKQVTQGGSNTVTVACGGTDVFNKSGGATSGTLTLLAQGLLLQYKASGGIWYVLADDLPLPQLDLRYLQPAGDIGGTVASPQVTSTHLASPLPLAQGGTGQASASAAYNALSPMTTLGDIEYESGANTASRLAGSTSATKKFLTQTGNGTVSAAPAWGSVVSGDLPAATTGAQGAVVLPAASVNYKPANPAGTVSTTLVMMGLGATCVFTPSGTGKVRIDVRAEWYVNTAATNVTIGARYGTGTAPANGAAVSGTRFGAPADSTVRGSGSAGTNNAAVIPWTDILTLTPATAYWFDLALAAGNASDQANLQNISVTIQELIA